MTANDVSLPSGARLIGKSGSDYFYAHGGWVNLVKNTWVKLSLSGDHRPNLDTSRDPTTFDPNDIREFGVEIETNGSASTVESPGILQLDPICIQ